MTTGLYSVIGHCRAFNYIRCAAIGRWPLAWL